MSVYCETVRRDQYLRTNRALKDIPKGSVVKVILESLYYNDYVFITYNGVNRRVAKVNLNHCNVRPTRPATNGFVKFAREHYHEV